jgi:hypothetical protein
LASKILAIIGLKEVSVEFFNFLWRNNLISPLETAVTSRNWLAAAEAVEGFIKGIMQKKFVNELIEKVGTATAAKIVGKVGARFVSILG